MAVLLGSLPASLLPFPICNFHDAGDTLQGDWTTFPLHRPPSLACLALPSSLIFRFITHTHTHTHTQSLSHFFSSLVSAFKSLKSTEAMKTTSTLTYHCPRIYNKSPVSFWNISYQPKAHCYALFSTVLRHCWKHHLFNQTALHGLGALVCRSRNLEDRSSCLTLEDSG